MKDTEKLEEKLRALVEPERVHFVEMFSVVIKKTLNAFLERRKPNLFLYDIYKVYYEPTGLRSATDYHERSKDWHENYQAGLDYNYFKPETYPAWEVTFKPDADAQIKKIAQQQAEDLIRVFINRARSKLDPIVDRRSNYTVDKLENNPPNYGNPGLWTGELQFHFVDGPRFIGRLQIKTNYTKFGDPYFQYPMTFHDVACQDEKAASASIEEIWGMVGYNPPPIPIGPPRKKWSKLVGGSVVLHEGKHVLLTTPGIIKKLGIPATAEQVARINAGSTGAYIEYIEGNTDNFKWTIEQRDAFIKMESNGNWNKASAERKLTAFNHYFPEG